jgi:hypothetical protein
MLLLGFVLGFVLLCVIYYVYVFHIYVLLMRFMFISEGFSGMTFTSVP